MNNFRLPYHLIVQEGIFEQVDKVMTDCIPNIQEKRVIIVTDENTGAGTVQMQDAQNEWVAVAGNTVPVENKTGTELPSTGGIGTTIFYALGGLMAVGAGVLLVAKKRMEA